MIQVHIVPQVLQPSAPLGSEMEGQDGNTTSLSL